VKSWTAFRRGLEEFISDYGDAEHVLADAAASGTPAESGGRIHGSDASSNERPAATMPVADRLGPDLSPIAEAPFDKRRPLRHFSAEGQFDDSGRGNREVAGTGGRYRPG
jgi:hypothetical protein